MAIDSAGKRASALAFASASLLVLPIADGTIDAADQQHLLKLYSGNAVAAAVLVPVVAIYVGPQPRFP